MSVITDDMVRSISPEEAVLLMSTESVVIIDVRDHHEWVTGHLESANLIPLDAIRSDPDATLPRNIALVFVCARGVRSLAAAKLAERLGLTNLYNIEGGLAAWVKAGLPIVSELPAHERAA